MGKIKLYGISGLGADARVFQALQVNADLEVIDWITPKKRESLSGYALRLSAIINRDEPFGLIGVSFGGMIATEIAKHLNPELTILISSAKTYKDLPWIYTFIGKSGIVDWIPAWCFDPPKIVAKYLFDAENASVLNAILNDADLKFTKWCVSALVTWNNEEPMDSIIQIHGTKDKLIPCPKDESVILINGGGHFIIVDLANEISQVINDKMKELWP